MTSPATRPWVVTLYCVFGFVRAFVLMIAIASPRTLEVSPLYPPMLMGLALAMIASSFFYWRMNRSGLWASTAAFVFQTVVVMMGRTGPANSFEPGFIVPLMGVVLGAVYWKRMG